MLKYANRYFWVPYLISGIPETSGLPKILGSVVVVPTILSNTQYFGLPITWEFSKLSLVGYRKMLVAGQVRVPVGHCLTHFVQFPDFDQKSDPGKRFGLFSKRKKCAGKSFPPNDLPAPTF